MANYEDKEYKIPLKYALDLLNGLAQYNTDRNRVDENYKNLWNIVYDSILPEIVPGNR